MLIYVKEHPDTFNLEEELGLEECILETKTFIKK